MMTREEILSIEEYCAEHKISHKKRLEEHGVDVRSWLEDTLRRIPTEKNVDQVLPQ